MLQAKCGEYPALIFFRGVLWRQRPFVEFRGFGCCDVGNDWCQGLCGLGGNVGQPVPQRRLEGSFMKSQGEGAGVASCRAVM